MPNIEMNIPHKLSQEEALLRIQSLLQKVKAKFANAIRDLKEEWNGNIGSFSFTVKGYEVSGILTVKPSSVELDGKIPFAAAFFKGKIKSVIATEAEKILV